MLNLVLLSAVAQEPAPAPQDERLPPKLAAEKLAAIGYPIVFLNGRDTIGPINGGPRVDVGMALKTGAENQGNTPNLAGIWLTIEIPVGSEVPLHEANRGFGSFLPAPDPYTIPHLGKTVTLTQDIDFRPGFDPKRVRKALDHFWKYGADYAARHGGTFSPVPPRDWSQSKFPDALVLEKADGTSFSRLAASWGFKTASPYSYSFTGTSYDIGGKVVCVDPEPFAFEPFKGAYRLIGYAPISESTDPNAWVIAQQRRVPGLQFRVPHYVWSESAAMAPQGRIPGTEYTPPVGIEVSRLIELKKGIEVGELRHLILQFAKDVAGLPKSTSVTP